MIARKVWGGLGTGVTVLAACAVAAAAGCGDRRDAADLAVGVGPFEQLRGVDLVALRAGGVRAYRKSAEPAPFEGLREPIGAFDVAYVLTGFDGSDGSWPAEDALVLRVEATRDWPSDSSAAAAWEAAMREIRDGLAVDPACADVTGPDFTMRVAEWDRGGGWSLSTTVAPAVRLANGDVYTARHSIAVRRQALTTQFPAGGTPNPDGRPTWVQASCTAP